MTQDSGELEAPLPAETETVCGEEEFAGIVAMHVPALVQIDNLVRSNRRARLSRRILATVSEEAAKLEDLLTDYDASYNLTFCSLSELVAALKSFSAAGYTVKVVELRTARRRCLEDDDADAAFREETARTLGFIEAGVRRILGATREEVERLCGTDLATAAPPHILHDSTAHRVLPHTLGADEVTDLKARIASEAALFLTALKTLKERSAGQRFEEADAMRQFVLEVCDEEQSRFFEAKLANIQSRYDTFVVNTRTEQRDENLRQFRFAVGVSLELIRIVAKLVHFYERHEDDLRPEEVKEPVTRLIDKHQVLDRVLNYALFYAHRFMELGKPYAETLLDTYTVSERAELGIPDGVILHARPAALIVKVVQHHGTPVKMTLGEETCYAGSITQIILTAASHAAEREVVFQGDRRPIADLRLLFEHRLGEDGVEGFPEELAYLKR